MEKYRYLYLISSTCLLIAVVIIQVYGESKGSAGSAGSAGGASGSAGSAGGASAGSGTAAEGGSEAGGSEGEQKDTMPLPKERDSAHCRNNTL